MSLKLIDIFSSNITIKFCGKMTQMEGSKLQVMYHLQKVLIIPIKNGCVTEYNGKVENTLETLQLFINPNINETNKILSWFASNGLEILLSQKHHVGSSTILRKISFHLSLKNLHAHYNHIMHC